MSITSSPAAGGDWASSLDSWSEGVTMPPWNAVTGDWSRRYS